MKNLIILKRKFLNNLNELKTSKNYSNSCFCWHDTNNSSFVSCISINLNIDNQLVVIKTPKNNKFLAVIDIEKEFITNEGKFKFSKVKNIPSIVKTSTGVIFKIYKPTYKEFVLLMKRGPQIIYT